MGEFEISYEDSDKYSILPINCSYCIGAFVSACKSEATNGDSDNYCKTRCVTRFASYI
jgi:hypothetical protein